MRKRLRGGALASPSQLLSSRSLPLSCALSFFHQINATSFAPITAIQFGANKAYEQALTGLNLAAPGSAWPTLAAAAAAGATSTLVGNPAELVMIRQQQHGTSLGAAAAGVWRQFGLRGFFRGQTMALGRESVYAACYLGLCPLLAAELDARRAAGAGGPAAALAPAAPGASANPAGATLVAAGTVAGLIAALGSQPFDTVKTRMQAYMGDAGRPGYAGSARAAVAAAVADGRAGPGGGRGPFATLWAGLLPRGFRIVGATIILQTVRSAALKHIEEGE